MFKGITRDKREKILSGVRNQKNPPVGLYTPKYNFVQNDSPKGLVKFDSSPKRANDVKTEDRMKLRKSEY